VEGNLRKHGVAEDIIEQVSARLRDQRLVDDQAFAQEWVENRSAFRPRGRYALRSELRQKGVPDPIIEQTLEDINESDLARLAAEKKARQLQELDWKEFFKKLSGHLSRRGFGYEIVVEASRQAWENQHPGQAAG
jgi:regulatory protein